MPQTSADTCCVDAEYEDDPDDIFAGDEEEVEDPEVCPPFFGLYLPHELPCISCQSIMKDVWVLAQLGSWSSIQAQLHLIAPDSRAESKVCHGAEAKVSHVISARCPAAESVLRLTRCVAVQDATPAMGKMMRCPGMLTMGP